MPQGGGHRKEARGRAWRSLCGMPHSTTYENKCGSAAVHMHHGPPIIVRCPLLGARVCIRSHSGSRPAGQSLHPRLHLCGPSMPKFALWRGGRAVLRRLREKEDDEFVRENDDFEYFYDEMIDQWYKDHPDEPSYKEWAAKNFDAARAWEKSVWLKAWKRDFPQMQSKGDEGGASPEQRADEGAAPPKR